jgi:hypothetical protein
MHVCSAIVVLSVRHVQSKPRPAQNAPCLLPLAECTSNPVTDKAAFSCATGIYICFPVQLGYVGDTCTGICDEGYVGPPVATCTIDGSWVVKGSCDPIGKCHFPHS